MILDDGFLKLLAASENLTPNEAGAIVQNYIFKHKGVWIDSIKVTDDTLHLFEKAVIIACAYYLQL